MAMENDAFLALCLISCEEKPKINFDRVAENAGVSKGGAAYKFRAIMKEFEARLPLRDAVNKQVHTSSRVVVASDENINSDDLDFYESSLSEKICITELMLEVHTAFAKVQEVNISMSSKEIFDAFRASLSPGFSDLSPASQVTEIAQHLKDLREEKVLFESVEEIEVQTKKMLELAENAKRKLTKRARGSGKSSPEEIQKLSQEGKVAAAALTASYKRLKTG